MNSFVTGSAAANVASSTGASGLNGAGATISGITNSVAVASTSGSASTAAVGVLAFFDVIGASFDAEASGKPSIICAARSASDANGSSLKNSCIADF